MDSRDKMTNDLTDQVSKQAVIINEKDVQIKHLETVSADLQKKQTGVDAIREALDGERSLVVLLNKQIESYKGRVAALSALNDELTAMNLNLQRQAAGFGANVDTGASRVTGSQNTIIGDAPEEVQ